MTYVTAWAGLPGENQAIIMAEMTETVSVEGAAGKARTRALIVPREHGAWGLMLVPLFTGVAAGLASAQHFWPLPLFVTAALFLFWLRTPVESLLGSGPMTARTSTERWAAFTASLVLTVASAACLIGLMWGGRNLKLLVIGSVAAVAFVAQVVFRTLGRKARMMSQLAGAVGLTATAPAAYYLGTGRLDLSGAALWIANWLFAWNQIHFVQVRIHAARAITLRDRLDKGRFFFLAQTVLLATLVLAVLCHYSPPLVILAFAPALVRGTRWFFRESEPLDVKRLGWSEMRQGITFGILLAIAFIFA
jgi:hypothetical protein